MLRANWLTLTQSTHDSATNSKSVAKRIGPKLLLSVALGGLFAWLVARGGVPLVPSSEAFDAMAWWAAPGYLVALAITHVVRAARWRWLIHPIKPLPFREVLALNWVGFFAIFMLPLRLGEFTRPTLTKSRHGVPISAGLGTIAVERVVDGLITSLCVAWALFALPRMQTEDPLANALPAYGYAALTLFGTALVTLAVFLWQRELAVRFTETVVGWVSKKLGRALAAKVDSVADGIRSIGSARLLSAFLFETILYWTCNASAMWLLGVGCGIPMTFSHALGIMGVLALGILLPAGPGLFGNFQLAISTGLKLYFAETLVGTQGAVYIFVLYGVQALWLAATGLVLLFGMNLSIRDLLGAGNDPPSQTPSRNTEAEPGAESEPSI